LEEGAEEAMAMPAAPDCRDVAPFFDRIAACRKRRSILQAAPDMQDHDWLP
jgi:hypothetical protein